MLLTKRWTKLRPHHEQLRLVRSAARFCLIPAGRRSGKTERAKRKLVRRALGFTKPNGWFVAGAPTHDQAKRIYWEDFKQLVPPALRGTPNESDLVIPLYNGAKIQVMGLDKPARVEGPPLDGLLLDEFGNMKPEVWKNHARPALSTPGRPGWAWIYGVPEGLNHYYDMCRQADAHKASGGTEWDVFTWPSADIISAAEVEAAKRDLDPLTFDQEYNASFVSFEGRAYYPFTAQIHAANGLRYNPELPLILCFDFNISPGVCVVVQEHSQPIVLSGGCTIAASYTAVIGEVFIPQNSNTPVVCRKIIADWHHHKGEVYCYGDATGGAGGTTAVMGSDWDLIKQTLRPVFGQRLYVRVGSSNPRERVRLNAMNSRLMTVTRDVRLLVDPAKAPNVVRDFEGVTLLEGGSGELDKDADPKLTHLTDALGYYVAARFPVSGGGVVSSSSY